MNKRDIILRMIGLYIVMTQVVMDFFVSSISETLESSPMVLSTNHIVFYVLGFWIFTGQSKKFSIIMPLAVFSVFFYIQYTAPFKTIDTFKIIQALPIVILALVIRYSWTASRVIVSFIITSTFILAPAAFTYLTSNDLNEAHVYNYIVFSETLMLFSVIYIVFQKYINSVIAKDSFTKFSLIVKRDMAKIFLINKEILSYSFGELHEAQEFNSIEIDSPVMIEVSYDTPLEKELPLKEVTFETREQITEAQPRAPSFVL